MLQEFQTDLEMEMDRQPGAQLDYCLMDFNGLYPLNSEQMFSWLQAEPEQADAQPVARVQPMLVAPGAARIDLSTLGS